MKKILTLALAAVMGLGLVVLPQAEVKEPQKTPIMITYNTDDKQIDYTLVNIEKDTLLSDLLQIPSGYELDKEKFENKMLVATGLTTTEKVMVKEKKEADPVQTNVAFKFVDQDGNYVYATTEKLEVGKHFALTEASKFFEAAQKNNAKLKVYEVVATDIKDDLLVVKENQPLVVTVTVDKMDEIQVACFDLDGRSLFTKIVTMKAPVNKWTNALAIAPKSVDNYWVLADVDANRQPVYFTKSYLKGGTDFLPAYYQTAPAKKYNGELEPTKAATQQAAKPGQVAKTGEVASVATGIGAILTLAGAALATTKRR